jgi:hypothetical protein
MVKVVIDNTKGLVQKAGSGTTVQNNLTANRLTDQVVRPNFTAATTYSTGGALVANTLNYITRTTSSTFTLPAAATCVKGDVIFCEFDAILANGQIDKFGTSGEFFSPVSSVLLAGDGAAGIVYSEVITRPNGSSNDFLNLTGATNGGPGVGSRLTFYFDGSQWCVNGVITNSGTGAVVPTAAFANS